MKTAIWFLGAFLVIVAVGCGDDDGGGGTGNCVSLCTEAQAGQCTSISGDCTAFCTALDNEQEAAGCTSQRNAYQSCLNVNADVCANDCGSLEVALSQCFTPHCIANSSDPDCQTLFASFQ